MTDWTSFATGFLERFQERTDERREEAKTFEEEQRQAAERNAQSIARRRAYADRVMGYTSYLSRNGVSDAQIQAAIATDPEAVQRLTVRVQQAVEANGGRPLGADDIDALISMPEGFVPLDMTNQEFVDRTFGLTTPDMPEETEEVTFWDRISGGAAMGQARERLDRTPYMEGMTIREINAAAQQADYNSLIPGTFMSITSADRSYRPTEQGIDFVQTFEVQLGRVESSDAMTRARQAGTEQELLEARMGGLIESYLTQYGASFLVDQESYIRSTMGDDYTDALIERYTSPEEAEPQPEPVPQPAPISTEAPQVTTDGPAAPQAPSATTEIPEVTLTEDQVPAAEAPPAPTPEAEEVPTAEGQLEGRDTERGYVVTGKDGVEYTYEDWQSLTRAQRQAAGLPTSVIGAQVEFRRFMAGLGMPEGRTATSRGRNAGRTPREDDSETNATGSLSRRSNRVANQLVEEYGVDRSDINFISRVGGFVQDFALERGVTTQDQMREAVESYAAENNMSLPSDVDFVASVLYENLVQNGDIAAAQQ